MELGRIVSTIGKYTGLRYITDIYVSSMELVPDAFGLNWLTVRIGMAAEWYNYRQTHLRACPECTWMIDPWPFTKAHQRCDEILSERTGITGPHSIAVAYCECGYPLTAKAIRRKTHVCEFHTESLRRLPHRRVSIANWFAGRRPFEGRTTDHL